MRHRHAFGRAGLAALAAGMVATVGAVVSGQQAKTETTGPEKVVQEQVEAYNRHDIDAFVKSYSPDNKRYVFPDQEMGTGLESLRKTYAKLFETHPELKVKIAGRIVQGDYVIDHEQVSGIGREMSAVAIYQVKGDKIAAVWFLK